MRLTDHDVLDWGPITIGRLHDRMLMIAVSSRDREEDSERNSLTVFAFGWAVRLWLPPVIKPYRQNLGNGLWEEHPRTFGVSLIESGFLMVHYGPQTFDSATTKIWSKRLPWTEWRFVRHSLYGIDGDHFWTELERQGKPDWDEWHLARESVPKRRFKVRDYDGAEIVATTYIEEREWRFGDGWFKWLSWFRKPMVRRSLDIAFSDEVGPDKGTWKGGLMGHSIDMLPGEMHESAFRRYCVRDHMGRERRKYRITYVGPIEEAE